MRRLSALLALLFASTLQAAEPVLAPYTKKSLIAHRGASGEAPEHTIEAYTRAIKHGADYVEPDLQMTKDGVLVCLHDTSLERTTNVAKVFADKGVETNGRTTWPVANFTLEEIQMLDAGSWKGKEFAGAKVPSFQEMIDVVKGKAGIIPETKAPEVYGKLGMNMEKELMAVLKKNKLDTLGADPKTPVVIQSFSAASLKVLKKEHDCKLPLVFLFTSGKTDETALKSMAEYADGIAPNKSVVLKNPDLVATAHKLKLSVTVWTFREGQTGEHKTVKDEMDHYLNKLGVDAVFTDNPDKFPKPKK
jgi:glycerophosphoryl diester phosphodiesterase